VPGMHGQTGKFLIVDFVDAAVAYKHVLSATLYLCTPACTRGQS
jgi:hypothetical protein